MPKNSSNISYLVVIRILNCIESQFKKHKFTRLQISDEMFLSVVYLIEKSGDIIFLLSGMFLFVSLLSFLLSCLKEISEHNQKKKNTTVVSQQHLSLPKKAIFSQ